MEADQADLYCQQSRLEAGFKGASVKISLASERKPFMNLL